MVFNVKKSILIILICSVLLNIVLAAVYILSKNSTENYRELFYANAQSASEHFYAYNQNGQNEEFVYAVADLNIMRQTVFLLEETKDDVYAKTHFNELYGLLVIYPEKLHPYSLDLTIICELLQEDCTNQTAMNKISGLINEINHRA